MSPSTVNGLPAPDDDHFEKTSKVYISIRDDIYAHRWPADAQINLQAIADELRVSRTPVREALIRLSVEHLVQLRPGKGFFIRQRLWQEDLHDLEVLFTLLIGMVEKSVLHFSGEGLFRLFRQNEESRAADIPLQVMFIENTYDRIIAPTGNVTATRLTRALTARTTFARSKILEDPEPRVKILNRFKELTIELESQNIETSIKHLSYILSVKKCFLSSKIVDLS